MVVCGSRNELRQGNKLRTKLTGMIQVLEELLYVYMLVCIYCIRGHSKSATPETIPSSKLV